MPYSSTKNLPHLNPCLVHPVALVINKKNEIPLFANTVVNKGVSFFLLLQHLLKEKQKWVLEAAEYFSV
jgi:hypothetical protein